MAPLEGTGALTRPANVKTLRQAVAAYKAAADAARAAGAAAAAARAKAPTPPPVPGVPPLTSTAKGAGK